MTRATCLVVGPDGVDPSGTCEIVLHELEGFVLVPVGVLEYQDLDVRLVDDVREPLMRSSSITVGMPPQDDDLRPPAKFIGKPAAVLAPTAMLSPAT